MKLISYRYTEIGEKANEIILKQKTVLPPFNPYIIAENLGIKVIRYSSLSDEYRSKMSRYFAFEENDAFSYINPIKNESKILVNDTIVSSGRINFTIFHEIGHIILNHTEQSELAESEADVFVCRIMMPYGIMRTIDEKDMNEDFIMSIAALSNGVPLLDNERLKLYFSITSSIIWFLNSLPRSV
jgi:Zn-dependent peptidase ImmA (M78 family)